MVHILQLISNFSWLESKKYNAYQPVKLNDSSYDCQSTKQHSFNTPEYHFLQPSPTSSWILDHSPRLWLLLSGIGYIQQEDHSKTYIKWHFIWRLQIQYTLLKLIFHYPQHSGDVQTAVILKPKTWIFCMIFQPVQNLKNSTVSMLTRKQILIYIYFLIAYVWYNYLTSILFCS